MTTLAFKDGVLASDSLSTSNGVRIGHCVKVGRIGSVLFGGCGSAAILRTFMAWVYDGMPGEPPPMMLGAGEDVFSGFGMVFPWDNELLLFEPGGIVRLHVDYYAAGSGREHAFGALGAGKSAIEAVESAIKFDTGSGGPIQSVRRPQHTSIQFEYPRE